MSVAYTPGLRITPYTTIRKTRRLPLKGEVLVKQGDRVEPDTPVARTFLPGIVHVLKASEILGVDSEVLPRYLSKKEGDKVARDEVIGFASSFFGLSKRELRSPINGTIESISTLTGNISIREEPQPLLLPAYIQGEVVEILPEEGAIIETKGAFLQGIFGVGGERWGPLKVVASSPQQVLEAKDIREDLRGHIIVGGGISREALEKAVEVGVIGVIVGSVSDILLSQLLGYDIGVAITGQEDIPLTLICMEGFGDLPLSQRTFQLLREFDSHLASINGATQIRAGVVRPEIIIPHSKEYPSLREGTSDRLEVGTKVRVIREPFFGEIGRVSALPPKLRILETGSKARVAEVVLESGERVIVPRANLEIISE